MRYMLCILLILLLQVSEGRVIRVDDDGGADFTCIQDAIDLAEGGDIIEIMAGSYRESVNVTKPLEIRGIGEDSPVIDPSGLDGVVISADGVHVDKIVIKNASNWGSTGFKILSKNACVSECNVSDSFIGILLLNGNNTVIRSNITGCHFSGIVSTASHNTIKGNRIHENNNAGIMLVRSIADVVDDNDASYNLGTGIKIYRSSESRVIRNRADTNDYGIALAESHGCVVENNTLLNNDYGIYLSLL